MGIGDKIQHEDWKKEKHVPVIECPDKVSADQLFDVHLAIGKEVPHPNTTEHHIQWITLYFHPQGGRYTYDVAHIEFNSHGAAVTGPNEGPVYTHHVATVSMRIKEPGTLYAISLCNIHGLWESMREVALQ